MALVVQAQCWQFFQPSFWRFLALRHPTAAVDRVAGPSIAAIAVAAVAVVAAIPVVAVVVVVVVVIVVVVVVVVAVVAGAVVVVVIVAVIVEVHSPAAARMPSVVECCFVGRGASDLQVAHLGVAQGPAADWDRRRRNRLPPRYRIRHAQRVFAFALRPVSAIRVHGLL